MSAAKDILMVVAITLTILSSLGFAETSAQTQVAQETSVIVHMKNGEEYKGEILSQDDGVIVLLTTNGEFHLLASKVQSIEEERYDGTFTFGDPSKTRYFFAPTAVPMNKKEGYYQNVLLTSNFVNYGVLNNLSIGGGFEFISMTLGEPLWFFTPKLGFEVSDTVSVGGGVLTAGIGFLDVIALGYGVVTFGTDDSHVTFGTGYGGDVLVFLASGAHRVNESISILSENYLIDNDVYFGIHGVRILSQKNTFDVGAIVVPDIMDVIPALPYVGYSRAFN